MRVSEMINKVDTLRLNQIEDAIKREWLSDLELLLINEVILTHEIPQWVAEHDTYCKYLKTNGRERLFDIYGNDELLIPAPYDEVYYWWLVSKIDQIDGNTERYTNDAQAYNNACLTYKDWYNRNYMPRQQITSFMRGSRNVFTTTESD